jgi:nucleoside 2-deoxyribosyltransferase
MKQIYIAGPLFNTHERWYLDHIADLLEKTGYQTFLPHRDAGLLGQVTLERRSTLFFADLEALDRCDICVALLTGPDQDSGTSAELGYCYAKGKPCYGITDDFRWMNNFIWGICSDGINIAKSPEDLIKLLK